MLGLSLCTTEMIGCKRFSSPRSLFSEVTLVQLNRASALDFVASWLARARLALRRAYVPHTRSVGAGADVGLASCDPSTERCGLC
eukprot:2565781-Amphidinium_carterae.1